jgi:AcrR family transcriptional regulator
VEDGYSGITTTGIQERAGVSRGRMLHHFPSRDVLLVAAAEHLARERVREVVDRLDTQATSQLDRSERIRALVDLMWQTFHEPHFAAALELWTAARTSPEIAQALLPGERLLGEVIRATLDRLWGTELAEHPRFPLVRELLLTSMRGAAVTYAFRSRDPRTDPHLESWADVATTLLAEPNTAEKAS